MDNDADKMRDAKEAALRKMRLRQTDRWLMAIRFGKEIPPQRPDEECEVCGEQGLDCECLTPDMPDIREDR